MIEHPPCEICGEPHHEGAEACPILREAAVAGAHPRGVSLRVYGAYLEARAALRGSAPAVAIRVLQWLLANLAEDLGVATPSFAATLQGLGERDAISSRVQASLFPSALSDDTGPERAWALMSIVEHAFCRLYLSPPPR